MSTKGENARETTWNITRVFSHSVLSDFLRPPWPVALQAPLPMNSSNLIRLSSQTGKTHLFVSKKSIF